MRILPSLLTVLAISSLLPIAATGQTTEFSAPDYTKLAHSLADGKLPIELPEVLWKFSSEVELLPDGTTKMVSVCQLTVADGVVYFGDDKGRLFALKASNGETIWTHEHGSRIAVEPSVDKDYVYFGSDKGITAVKRASGVFAWRHAIEHGTDVTPLPIGKRVIASGYDGNSYALNAGTGEVLWKHDFAKDAPPDQPGFDGERARFQKIVARPNGSASDGETFVQCVFDQSRVVALDCETGKRRWTFQAAGWVSAAPTIVKDRVYVGSQDSHVYCLHRDTGAVVWKFKTPGWFSTPVAVFDGKVFVTHHRGRLYVLDAATGEQIKLFQSMDEIEAKSLHGGGPFVANKTAYFCTGKGMLYGVDFESNAVRWQLRPSEKSELHGVIATDGQRIFVRSNQDLKEAGECAIIAIGLKR